MVRWRAELRQEGLHRLHSRAIVCTPRTSGVKRAYHTSATTSASHHRTHTCTIQWDSARWHNEASLYPTNTSDFAASPHTGDSSAPLHAGPSEPAQRWRWRWRWRYTAIYSATEQHWWWWWSS